MTRESLDGLTPEGLVECYDGPIGPTFALNAIEPTARVLTRLQIEAGRSPGLHQIKVATMKKNS